MTTTHMVLRYAHISMGILGILSGAAAMTFRKGSPMHRKAGNVFCLAMLVMAGTGLYISIFITPVMANIMGGSMALYLTATAWLTVWRPSGVTGRLEIGAMIWGLTVAIVGITFGILALGNPKGTLQGFPFVGYFIFASIATLGSLSDFRMINRGGFTGAARTTRHLWRISFAFFIATGSFFFGQPKFVPTVLKETGLYIVAGLLPLVLMLYWLIRIRIWPSLRKAWALSRMRAIAPGSR